MNKFFYTLLIGIIIYLLINRGSDNTEPLDFNNQDYFIEKVDSFQKEIVRQQALLTYNSEEAAKLLGQRDSALVTLSQIRSIVKSTRQTSIRDTFIKLDTFEFVIRDTDTVLVPCGRFKDAWASIHICSNDSVSYIKDISFVDTTTTIMHVSGFVNKKYNFTTINSSPYINTTSYNSVVVKKDSKRSFLEKTSFVALGFLFGALAF